MPLGMSPPSESSQIRTHVCVSPAQLMALTYMQAVQSEVCHGKGGPARIAPAVATSFASTNVLMAAETAEVNQLATASFAH